MVAPPPKELKYNFSKKSIKHIDINGQEKQPILVNEKIFKNKLNNGFFVEAGAWDGESFSNTLFFELKKNWTGLLVEPNPDAFEMLIRKVCGFSKIIYLHVYDIYTSISIYGKRPDSGNTEWTCLHS